LLTERLFGEEVAVTAQQAPHPPLWRRFLSLPHTLLGWWAIGLSGIGMVLTSLFDNATFDHIFDVLLKILGMTGTWMGTVLMVAVTVTGIISVLSGPVVALIAVVRDRSLLVWVAMVPGVLVLSGLAKIVMSKEIGTGELPIWYGLPIGVLLWAVLVISLMLLNSRVWSKGS
jgi:hypothetical protein